MPAPLKVLCVDDNRDAADTTAVLLRHAGFDVRTCYEASAALAEAERFGPDVCVVDFTMPGMDGAALGRHLKDWAVGPQVRLIAVTARWDVEARHRTRNAGFDAHLVKPAEPEELVALVRGEVPAVA